MTRRPWSWGVFGVGLVASVALRWPFALGWVIGWVVAELTRRDERDELNATGLRRGDRVRTDDGRAGRVVRAHSSTGIDDVLWRESETWLARYADRARLRRVEDDEDHREV